MGAQRNTATAVKIINAVAEETRKIRPRIGDAQAVAVVDEQLHRLEQARKLLEQEGNAFSGPISPGQRLLQVLDIVSSITYRLYQLFCK